MSLLLDALQRNTSGGQGADRGYLYSAEDPRDPSRPRLPPTQSDTADARVAMPNGFVGSLPRWIWLAFLGGVMLLMVAAAGYFWLEQMASSPSVPAPLALAHPSRPAEPALPVAPADMPAPPFPQMNPPLMAQTAPVPTVPLDLPVLATPPMVESSDSRADAPRRKKFDAVNATKAPVDSANRPLGQPAVPQTRQATVRSEPTAPSTSQPAVAAVQEDVAQGLFTAWTSLQNGQWADAEAGYRAVIGQSKSPEPDALLGLAVALHRQKRWSEAWNAYEASLKVWPNNPVAPTAMLDILASTNAPTAEARLKQWITLRPRDAVAHSLYGQLLGRKGQWGEAQAMFRSAVELDPINGAYAFNLAVALDKSGRVSEAAHQYQSALRVGVVAPTAAAIQARLAEIAQVEGHP